MTKHRGILDPNFNYTPAVKTDLEKTFARIRREMKRKAEAEAAKASPPIPISRRRP